MLDFYGLCILLSDDHIEYFQAASLRVSTIFFFVFQLI